MEEKEDNDSAYIQIRPGAEDFLNELSEYFEAKQGTKTTEEIEILTAKLIDYNNSLIDYNKQLIKNNEILIAVNDYKIQQLETEIAIYSDMKNNIEAIAKQENNS